MSIFGKRAGKILTSDSDSTCSGDLKTLFKVSFSNNITGVMNCFMRAGRVKKYQKVPKTVFWVPNLKDILKFL